ncbi:hypothetical protein SAMN02745166_02393 [Prosthecobacter debontii]|uniref:Uncharacterized protein n=1 Tax=Prosthecobacter debontii TaxID=48467 RepID=A0A1T4Y4L5_9BACT|nr:hypothetical protein [Prosthecobacter debontii]SKA96458.1 hypothetical protein SAMN02745166_02393 [Prosthecobacter debontii]
MKFTLLALLSLLGVCTALAQTSAPATPASPNQEEVTQDGLWDGRLKGGSYLVRCTQILALSKHEYVADSVARVVEVNLTLNSSMNVRFYYLEPLRLEGGGIVGAGQQALDKARAMVQDAASRVSPTLTTPKVVKNYPTSTHAHTIEFVIADEERLNSLHASLERAFRTGRGRIWRE